MDHADTVQVGASASPIGLHRLGHAACCNPPGPTLDNSLSNDTVAALADRQMGNRRLALAIDVQQIVPCSEHNWESLTCPSRLQVQQDQVLQGPSLPSPGKAGATFDAFGDMDDGPGCTPISLCHSKSQPLAPRKSITCSPSQDAIAKLFPEKPHSCPPGRVGKRASRPVLRVRVKRSLNLVNSQRGTEGRAAGSMQRVPEQPQQQEQQQQQEADACSTGQPQPGAVRKRSEVFSPAVPRKLSRSMEDMVAAGIMAKLQLSEGSGQT